MSFFETVDPVCTAAGSGIELVIAARPGDPGF
jgi:hypothetical protein